MEDLKKPASIPIPKFIRNLEKLDLKEVDVEQPDKKARRAVLEFFLEFCQEWNNSVERRVGSLAAKEAKAKGIEQFEITEEFRVANRDHILPLRKFDRSQIEEMYEKLGKVILISRQPVPILLEKDKKEFRQLKLEIEALEAQREELIRPLQETLIGENDPKWQPVEEIGKSIDVLEGKIEKLTGMPQQEKGKFDLNSFSVMLGATLSEAAMQEGNIDIEQRLKADANINSLHRMLKATLQENSWLERAKAFADSHPNAVAGIKAGTVVAITGVGLPAAVSAFIGYLVKDDPKHYFKALGELMKDTNMQEAGPVVFACILLCVTVFLGQYFTPSAASGKKPQKPEEKQEVLQAPLLENNQETNPIPHTA